MQVAGVYMCWCRWSLPVYECVETSTCACCSRDTHYILEICMCQVSCKRHVLSSCLVHITGGSINNQAVYAILPLLSLLLVSVYISWPTLSSLCSGYPLRMQASLHSKERRLRTFVHPDYLSED